MGSLHTAIPSAGRGRLRDRSGRVEPGGRPEGSAIAVDGKAMRGIHGQDWWPDMLTNPWWMVGPVQGELTTARQLTAELLPVAGNVITGDALYCQRDYCQHARRDLAS